MRIPGIDVSAYQGSPDWGAVRASGVEWVMIKASQGLRPAERFAGNIGGAYAAGLRCGTYHFLEAATRKEAEAEMEKALAVLEPFRDKLGLYVALDVESGKLPKSKALLTEIVRLCYGLVEAAGFRCIVYTNPHWLRTRLEDISDLRLWLAWWRSKDNAPSLSDYPNLRLWQWGVTRVGGIMGDVDGNFMLAEDAEKAPPEAAADWAADAWRWAYDKGLMDGTRPKEPLTRQEAAVLLRRVLERQA